MDFIPKLPKTTCIVDSIWFIVDHFTKSVHWISVQESISVEMLAEINIREVVARNGVPVSVVSDRDVRFTSRLWKKFHDDLGTYLHFNTTFHL